MNAAGEAPRPGFAEELLVRLERDCPWAGRRSPWKAIGVVAAGVSAVCLLAGWKRHR
ncbi:MAG TPA: hypothetical protein VHN37_12000 [Actinomycetota bacterium]|nr:hypothetical protein [Actinomycetota bacterium]